MIWAFNRKEDTTSNKVIFNWIPSRRRKRAKLKSAWNGILGDTKKREMTDEDWMDRKSWKVKLYLSVEDNSRYTEKYYSCYYYCQY